MASSYCGLACATFSGMCPEDTCALVVFDEFTVTCSRDLLCLFAAHPAEVFGSNRLCRVVAERVEPRWPDLGAIVFLVFVLPHKPLAGTHGASLAKSGARRRRAPRFGNVPRRRRSAGRTGFMIDEWQQLQEKLQRCVLILEPFTKPTWFDRHVWQL